ncbi:MAG: FadR family transcriptional regulator [Spirochaetes bacterium]|nr:FadR family transcriptional regulator [Spirochaetota bacterium]
MSTPSEMANKVFSKKNQMGNSTSKVALRPVNRSRLHEEIVSQIQRKIISGEIKAGEKLPAERELAVELGVNRATLREAVKKLEAQGLVEVRHGDGVYVKDFLESENLDVLKAMIYHEGGVDSTIIDSLLIARIALLPEIAAVAAVKRKDEHVQKLKEIVELGKNMPALEADLAVHHTIARASENYLVIFILNFFNKLFREYGKYYFDDPQNEERSRKFHREIFSAIARGDAPRAKRIMRDVLIYARERTMNAMRKSL